ncbi:peptidoglycan recognition family protein [Actinomadura citrea]|uniref:peptidoglycan recognition protein family protein n=1 Tax=Actinomadura citrea TaxID=46158 RepID=UPI0039A59AE2
MVHHTASANATDHSLEHALGLSRTIQNFHMDTNGWDDIGQQLTISRGGHLMEGRNRTLEAIGAGTHAVGAHTLGQNDHTIGIENEGTYTTVKPTGALWAKLVSTCARLCDVYGPEPHAAIVGHRDHNATACPGDALYALLPRLRDQVADRLGERYPAEAPGAVPGGLPGPRFTSDHGPAVGPGDPTR